MRIHAHTYIHIDIRINTHISTFIYQHSYFFTYIIELIYTHISSNIYILLFQYEYQHISTYINIYQHAYISTCIYQHACTMHIGHSHPIVANPRVLVIYTLLAGSYRFQKSIVSLKNRGEMQFLERTMRHSDLLRFAQFAAADFS